jgi:hypothetical protein
LIPGDVMVSLTYFAFSQAVRRWRRERQIAYAFVDLALVAFVVFIAYA